MVDYRTKAQVEAAAEALRKRHDAFSWSADVTTLIKAEGLELATFMPAAPCSVAQAALAEKQRVKAIYAAKESAILLSTELHTNKEPFAKGHELGHAMLEWHRRILYVCDEQDLSFATREQMEWEANHFAGQVLIPPVLLQQVYSQYPDTMETVLAVKEWSSSSIETAAMAFASNHSRKVAALLLDQKADDMNQPCLRLARKACSTSAAKSLLGTISKGQIFSSSHSIYLYSRGSAIQSGQTTIGNKGPVAISLLNTSYRVIALLVDQS